LHGRLDALHKHSKENPTEQNVGLHLPPPFISRKKSSGDSYLNSSQLEKLYTNSTTLVLRVVYSPRQFEALLLSPFSNQKSDAASLLALKRWSQDSVCNPTALAIDTTAHLSLCHSLVITLVAQSL
jgi:hypothetical protein